MSGKLALLLLVFILRAGTRLIRLSTFLTRFWLRHGGSQRRPGTRVWIDVGAHRGETTFEQARSNPDLVVYAFEPDVSIASHRYALLDNFIVIPMAVSDRDGFREFHLNSNDRTSSLLPLDHNAMQGWRGVSNLHTVQRLTVPTIRLDTFLSAMRIESVEYLKIDAQGHDLEVIRSLGNRIRDVAELRVEACAAAQPMYSGAHNSVNNIIAFMQGQGFELSENSPETLGQEANLAFRQQCGSSTLVSN